MALAMWLEPIGIFPSANLAVLFGSSRPRLWTLGPPGKRNVTRITHEPHA